MRIGTHLIAAGDVRQIETDAAATAARGLDSVWTSQQPGGWDPLAVLTGIGDGPGELGTAVVPTYPRHPVALATQALTVQAMTGGRLTLGIGPSHAVAITAQFGIPYRSPARHTREYLEVLRPLLRGEYVQYSGDFFTVDTQLEVNAPEPPVLISALRPRMLEVARDLADGTIAIWIRPETVSGYLVPRLREGQRVAVMVKVAITTDPAAARETVARDFAMVGDLPAYRALLDRGGLSGPADTLIAGSETTVARELERFADAGVTDLIVNPFGTPRDRARVLVLLAEIRT
ncbi:TIGR03564 family F420-dependent LLM class oxidoreductase [Amycolatopsis cynarae]|uniref:TIGR03564 family F420-dependent LLM class oxidoreductase n=1 Tax=Amycolatopsis cynarae TaxID=2995223 RepID=A0ABY7B8S5_9PSEU|nr:TIGR03564 family F420-dependent LLM class oxidoreductase [Amycolatopsis sp. HUAS 11-8]WAL68762.1 TIGR03564 family F420-dependent LLM class oxidoreductase [Amycolatopsis sp. HUAS 11-8]